MPLFTITSTVSVDGHSVRSNTVSYEVKAFTDYERDISTTYVALISGEDQPSPFPLTVLHNTGGETAIVRTTTNGTDYYFTALPAGCTMQCPLRNDVGLFAMVDARGESADTTIRVIAMHI